MTLLDSTMRDLAAARFTFSSDCEAANAMMADFEWSVKTATEQAMAQDPASGLTLPPGVMHVLRNVHHNIDSGARRDMEAPTKHGSSVELAVSPDDVAI